MTIRGIVRVGHALAALSLILPAGPAAAQVVLLHSFTGTTTDGQNPEASLFASGGVLYGMTQVGGTAADGTVFRINTDGTGFGLLHSFVGGANDGDHPHGSLVQSGSTLFGMTQSGGGAANSGTAFKINTDGSAFGLLHRFVGGITDGFGPLGTPALSGSTLYGFTPQGGTANLGTVFKVNADGTGFSVLRSFTNSPTDGAVPSYSTVVVSGSTIYGMTGEGGTANQGAVFRMNTDGSGFALLHSFVPATGDAWAPAGSVILSGSTLYGMTGQGGGAAGTVFKINADGTGYQILHSFTGVAGGGDGANPLGSLLINGSTLYGMTGVGGTADLGTIFQINIDGTGYAVLHSFVGGAGDGARPAGDLIISGSTLYGLTGAGGANNLGTVFAFPISVPEPSTLLLVAGGAVGVVAARRRAARR